MAAALRGRSSASESMSRHAAGRALLLPARCVKRRATRIIYLDHLSSSRTLSRIMIPTQLTRSAPDDIGLPKMLGTSGITAVVNALYQPAILRCRSSRPVHSKPKPVAAHAAVVSGCTISPPIAAGRRRLGPATRSSPSAPRVSPPRRVKYPVASFKRLDG